MTAYMTSTPTMGAGSPGRKTRDFRGRTRANQALRLFIGIPRLSGCRYHARLTRNWRLVARMQLEEIKALVNGRPAARRPRSSSGWPATSCWSTRSPNTSSAAAASACGPCRSCWRPGPAATAASKHVRRRRDHRIHPHRHPAARRRRRRLGPAPRPRHRQRGLGQRSERAGRRLPLFALVPDDGRARQHAHHGRDGQRDQQDRRGRSAAADERARPGHHRRALLRGHLPQDREAVRGRRADRRDPVGRSAEIEQRWSITAGTSALPSSSSTTRSTTGQRRGTRQEPGRRPGRGQADAASYLCACALAAERRGATAPQRSRPAASKSWRASPPSIESTGGLAYTARLARRENDLAIEALADCPSRRTAGPSALADFAVERTY